MVHPLHASFDVRLAIVSWVPGTGKRRGWLATARVTSAPTAHAPFPCVVLKKLYVASQAKSLGLNNRLTTIKTNMKFLYQLNKNSTKEILNGQSQKP